MSASPGGQSIHHACVVSHQQLRNTQKLFHKGSHSVACLLSFFGKWTENTSKTTTCSQSWWRQRDFTVMGYCWNKQISGRWKTTDVTREWIWMVLCFVFIVFTRFRNLYLYWLFTYMVFTWALHNSFYSKQVQKYTFVVCENSQSCCVISCFDNCFQQNEKV